MVKKELPELRSPKSLVRFVNSYLRLRYAAKLSANAPNIAAYVLGSGTTVEPSYENTV